MSRRSSRTVALLPAVAAFATSALAHAQDNHVVGFPQVTGAPIQFHRLPWPSTPVVVQGMIQDDYSGQPLNSGCHIPNVQEYVAGFALQVRMDRAVYPCPGSRDERDRRPARHHTGYDSHSASRQWNTLAHATHTRRIPNQRKLLARHNGQRLVVVNGVSARTSIVTTGPPFRRTRLCDAGRDINLHATRSHATGVEARR